MTIDVFEANALDPLKPGGTGPITRRNISRTIGLYAIVFAVGLTLLLTGPSSSLQVFGEGLWLPGGGFIASGGWRAALFPLTLIFFAIGMFAWFGAGLAIAPILVWLGAAIAAAMIAPSAPWAYGPVVNLAIVAGFIAWRVAVRTKSNADGRKVFEIRSAALPAASAAARDSSIPAPDLPERELSTEQLAALRYALDRALQPIGSWNGFEQIDEFQSASRRYQLNGLGYALSLSQSQYTPCFHGYLSQAQRNLIDQYRRPEVWRYWIYESIGGHLNFTNFDPAGKDNIMLTAFYAQMISLYMSATGDRRYVKPGSLSFPLNARKTYEHDIHSVVQSLIDNFQASPYCLYPCEPNWVYPICNHYGMSALKIYDRLFGTSHAESTFPNWLQGVDTEFTAVNGSVIGVRSSYTGFEFRFPAGDLGLSVITNGFMPSRAWRMWSSGRGDLLRLLEPGAEGRSQIRTTGPGFDGGNYRTGHGRAMAGIAYTAREFGDEEIATAALNTLNRIGGRRDDGGVLRFTEVSNLGNSTAVQAIIGRRNFWRDAIAKGPPAHIFTAPLLAEADYPAVQVAKAYSNGDDLQLVLYPGVGDIQQTLGFERLRPGREYAVVGGPGGTLTADREGRARLRVSLTGRTPINLEPKA